MKTNDGYEGRHGSQAQEPWAVEADAGRVRACAAASVAVFGGDATLQVAVCQLALERGEPSGYLEVPAVYAQALVHARASRASLASDDEQASPLVGAQQELRRQCGSVSCGGCAFASSLAFDHLLVRRPSASAIAQVWVEPAGRR